MLNVLFLECNQFAMACLIEVNKVTSPALINLAYPHNFQYNQKILAGVRSIFGKNRCKRRLFMSKYGKLYPVSFGFAWGVVAGLVNMLLIWSAARWSFAMPVVSLMQHVYHNVEPTFIGGLWGFFWGFLHSFVFALLVALVYNCSCKCFCPAGSCEPCD